VVADSATQTLTNKTLTSPTITGATITVASTAAPAFSAYAGTTTSVTTNTWTKVTLNTEEFDTNNNFTSSRFTPTVAGYYQINASVIITGNGAATTVGLVGIYKNATLAVTGTTSLNTVLNYALSVTSTLMYLNGSTDYIELYAYQNSGITLNAEASSTSTRFSASMVRSA
jgi:hypothetical protein